MFDFTVSSLASQWFDEYVRLAYWIARRWSRRLLDSRARGYSADELEEPYVKEGDDYPAT